MVVTTVNELVKVGFPPRVDNPADIVVVAGDTDTDNEIG